MSKKWQLNQDENIEQIENLKQNLNLNLLLATILANRGINTENVKKFLNPTRHDFYNPFEMPDMEKAVERIITALNSQEKTMIYGDYDVDGITSITVLKSFLRDIGLNCRKLYSQ